MSEALFDGDWGQYIEAMVVYLEAHPVTAMILVLLVIFVFGSLIKKLVKLAVILVLVFLVFVYFTHEEVAKDWRNRGEVLLKKAGEKATDYGSKALEKGIEALD